MNRPPGLPSDSALAFLPARSIVSALPCSVAAGNLNLAHQASAENNAESTVVWNSLTGWCRGATRLNTFPGDRFFVEKMHHQTKRAAATIPARTTPEELKEYRRRIWTLIKKAKACGDAELIIEAYACLGAVHARGLAIISAPHSIRPANIVQFPG